MTNGRVHFDELPPPVRRAVLALQESLYHHTDYAQVQISFSDLAIINEFVKPVIDTRGPRESLHNDSQ